MPQDSQCFGNTKSCFTSHLNLLLLVERESYFCFAAAYGDEPFIPRKFTTYPKPSIVQW
jgi:hypothetical protein